jgi:MSHA biogenesis protein MshN
MSVINQLLIDLEKRRVSGPERRALPDHVRAVPESESSWRSWWLGAGALIAATGIAAAWAVWPGVDGVSRAPAAAPLAASTPAGAAPASPPVTMADAVRHTPVARGSEAPASRLSLELSTSVHPTAVVEDTRADRGGRESPAPLPVPLFMATATDERAARDAVPSRAEPARAPSTSAPVPGAPARQVARIDAATASEPAQEPPSARRPAVERAQQVSAAEPPRIRKEVREPEPRELAENEFRQGTGLLHRARLDEARARFEAALEHYPRHQGARQALVGLLLEGKRLDEAERVLDAGVKLIPSQIGFAMALARIQVDRGNTPAAIDTLLASQGAAQANADHAAFLAALLQREGRHEEAVAHFNAALRSRPESGVWLLGLGLSLQALGHDAEARVAYRRARSAHGLAPELAAFADQRLRELQ